MKRRPARLLLLAAAGLLLLIAAVGTWQATLPGGPATPRDRAVAVESTLRCPTCQGLSIADSPSPIAGGMRQQVESRVAAGATDEQIRRYFTSRYGDWILLDPPRRGIGWLVWLLPAGVLLAGGWLVRRTLRRRGIAGSATDDEGTLDHLRAADALEADASTSTEQFPEAIVAALADLRAARLEAEVDPAAAGGVDDARLRLAATLGEHAATARLDPNPGAHQRPRGTEPAATDAVQDPSAQSNEPGPAPSPELRGDERVRRRRRLAVRYVLPAAALLFAGVLAVTLRGAVGDRPTGAVVTGTFATAAPSMTGSKADSSGTAALERATRDRPEDPATWLAYASALDQSGDLPAAEAAYRRTLTLDPRDLAATEQYAWLLTRGGSPTEALALLDPLAQSRPADPQVVLLLGLAQRGAGDPANAATLRHYLELAPTSPQAPVIRRLVGRTP